MAQTERGAVIDTTMGEDDVAQQGQDRRVRSAADRFATWAAGSTGALALVSFAVAVTTPPRNGPFAQVATALNYPYADGARYVPRDFIWMYLALLMMLAFVTMAACVHHRARGDAKLFGTIGTMLATASFAIITADYFVQLRTVQVALVRGEAVGVVALTQYNPHGVFIALEEAGYLVAGISFAFLAFALSASKLERAARWVLLAASALTVAGFLGMSAVFGLGIEYRFEVAGITFVWVALGAVGILLALAYRRPQL